MKRMHRGALIGVSAIVAAMVVPAHAVLPEGCIAGNPYNIVDPGTTGPCTFGATVRGQLGGVGDWIVTIERPRAGTITITSEDVATNPACVQEPPFGTVPGTCALGTIIEGDTVSAEATSPGSVIAVGTLSAVPDPANREYVEMADGTELAVYISYPPGWDGSPMPVVLEYDGYDGGGSPLGVAYYVIDRSKYILVHAGVRGAGCSGGEWSAFSRQHAQDGAALVEWAADQPWSNGDVGMYGFSYSGFMAAWTATERPQSLKAIAVTGIEADLYRDLSFAGGVANAGYPVAWHDALRPSAEHTNGTVPATGSGDARCAEHIAARTPANPGEHHSLQRASGTDSDWWRNLSLARALDRIEVPTSIAGFYQDEQILARGPAVAWEMLSVERRQLLLTNGYHMLHPTVVAEQQAWLDHFLLGEDNGVDDKPRVQMLLESHRDSEGTIGTTGRVSSDAFPLAQTDWTRLYAGPGGRLAALPPTEAGGDLYVNGSRRNVLEHNSYTSATSGHSAGQEVFWSDGPDGVTYRTEPATSTRVVAGPMVASLHARVHGIDAEVFVQISQEDPDGNRSLLQRGLLRASHNRIDPARSWFDGDVMYRPWRPHMNREWLTPGEPVQLDVEIWPVGFVLRPGHRLVMTVMGVPAVDGMQSWQPRTGSQLIELLYGPEHPTHLLVPFVEAPADLGPAPACGEQVSVKCARPLHADG